MKNWGRWGADDQLGAANLITDAKRKEAAALVRNGIAIGLAHSPLKDVAPDNPSAFSHTMNRGLSTDTYSVSYHGYAHSHVDALCHILYKDQTYNGHRREDVLTEKGCTQLGVQNLRNGIVTRGILLDIARLKNVPYLEPGTPVFVVSQDPYQAAGSDNGIDRGLWDEFRGWDGIDDLRIAVSEATTNAIEAHADLSGDERILIRCNLGEDHIEVQVLDSAGGFDPDEVGAAPDASAEDRLEWERGLGLPLMQTLTDETDIRFTEGGTAVRLVVYTPRHAPGS